MTQGLLKTLENIGKKASSSIIRAQSGSAIVHFAIPLKVVKVENQPPKPAYAKLSRHIATGLTVAYATVLKEMTQQSSIDPLEVYTIKVDDMISVVISGGMEIKEIGSNIEVEGDDEVQEFLRDVVVASNAGYLKAQIKAVELGKEFANM